MSPTQPLVTTEIAFSTGPADPNPVWSDISTAVKELHSKRGRSNPLENVDAGTCTYVLDNRDRSFEPLFAASAYYPYVKPMRRIRSYAKENVIRDSWLFYRNLVPDWVPGSVSTGSVAVPAYGVMPGPYGDWSISYTLVPADMSASSPGPCQLNISPKELPSSSTEWWTLSVWARASRNNAPVILRAYSKTASSSVLGTFRANSPDTLVTNSGWTRIDFSFQLGHAGDSFIDIAVGADVTAGGSPWVSGDILYVGACMLRRNTQVAEDFSETINIFDGYIEGWPQMWSGGLTAEVQVNAVDGFKPLAPMQVVRGNYDLVVMDDIPSWYFRLGEAYSTQAATNEVAPNIQDGTYRIDASGSPTLGNAQSAIIGDYDTQVYFVGGVGDVHRNSVVLPTKQFAVEFILDLNGTAIPSLVYEVIFAHGDTFGDVFGSPVQVSMWYTAAGGGTPYVGKHLALELKFGDLFGGQKFVCFFQNPTGTNAYWQSPHHIAISWDGTGQDGRQGWPLCYFDGVVCDPKTAPHQTYTLAVLTAIGWGTPVKPYTGKISLAGQSRPITMGNNTVVGSGFGLYNTYLDEVAYWVDKIPASGWAARHFAAFQYGRNQEDSGARMSALLDQATISGSGFNPWPAARRNIDVGQSQVLGFRWNEQNLIDLIRQDAKSEGGIFFFAADGKATFRNRLYPIQYPQGVPKGYLSDRPVPASSIAPYSDVGTGGVDFDDQDIYNDVRIQRFKAGYGDASGEQKVSDATSQNDYMVRTLSLDDSIVTADTEALNQANWYLNLYKNPGLKAKSIQVKPLDDPTDLWRIISKVDLNDRLNITRHPPPGTGATMVFDVLVQTVQHDIVGPNDWTVEYGIYPGPTNDYWQLPASATNDEYAAYSVLGSTTRVAY